MTSAIITEEIEKEYPDVLDVLLQDHSTKKNIVWGTDNYKINGKGYHAEDTMKISSISGKMRKLIKPRICKTEREQKKRSKYMAEVFTPSWVCNFQNNAVDEKWFGHKDAFNKDEGKTWIPTEKVIFDNDKTWQDYVKDLRLEITCGEAPYLTSRYDATSGEQIPVRMRTGLLDRKLRVISENVEGEKEWIEWAKTALKSVYGFDFQGDNVLLARENLFVDVLEFFQNKFGQSFENEYANVIAQLINVTLHYTGGINYKPTDGKPFKDVTNTPLFDPDVASCFYISPFFVSNMPVYSQIWLKFGWFANYIIYVISFSFLATILYFLNSLIKYCMMKYAAWRIKNK